MKPALRAIKTLVFGVQDPAQKVRILRRQADNYTAAGEADYADVLYEQANRLETKLSSEAVRKRPAND